MLLKMEKRKQREKKENDCMKLEIKICTAYDKK